MITLTIKKERVGPVLGRHPWVFSGAIKNIPEGVPSGEPVELVDDSGKFLAAGYFNSYSQITVRVWSWEQIVVNQKFFEKRITAALALRENFVLNKITNACRLVNGENDLLPGLIVDKYDDCLVVQFHNAGIESWKKEIVAALKNILKPTGIYERSDVRERHRNQAVISPAESPLGRGRGGLANVHEPTPGLRADPAQAGNFRDDNGRGLLYGKVPDEIKILENGYKFIVDVKGGQKTGFFLDQRDKRQALQKYVKGKKVLNCFSYTGGFSVYALGGGAKQVVSVDASEPALQTAEKNVQLNKLDEKKCQFILADVKDYLADRQPGEFDVIILDPPAFVKDRHKIQEGLQGYRKINELALRVLPPGGILVTCSCSTHVSLTDFRFMLSAAAGRVGRTVQILETFSHGIDHPALAAFTEGEYLKCLFAIVN